MQDLQLDNSLIVEFCNVKDAKLELVKVLASVINTRYKTQKEAATALGIDQPKVSQINRLKIDGFSLQYLISLLTVLRYKINIRIKSNFEI
ncbi:MAG: XRE family transcriptional regulator [Wolbachia endosymbiont of Tyrophagus putrescentiae]|nr:XRE family transcriptional regulator [Wolbachia endosymbiont of Tyrophagus putrescentiae]